MPKIFISYRRKSWAFTDRLVEVLQQRLEADIFIDRTNIDQDDFEHSIVRHLRTSQLVLLIVSDLTFAERIHRDDDWVRREIREALTLGIPLVMVRIDGLLPPLDLPDDIRDVARKQGIPFYAEYFLPAVEKLTDFIVRMGIAQHKQMDTSRLAVKQQTASDPKQKVIDGKVTLDEAVALLENDNFHKAAFLLESLIASGYTSRYVDLEALLHHARYEAEQADLLQRAQTDYAEIAALAAEYFTEDQARAAFVHWCEEHPTLVDALDSANLRERFAAKPMARRKLSRLRINVTLVIAGLIASAFVAQTYVLQQVALETALAQQTAAPSTQSALDLTTTAQIVALASTTEAVLETAFAPSTQSALDLTTTAQIVALASATEAARVYFATETAAQATLNRLLATSTPSPTSTHTPTLTPLQAALERARTSVTANARWTPFAHDFGDGVSMMLVPAGCFMIGSSDGQSNEQPVHEQCWDEPFWIDRDEVTNAQYERFIDAGGYTNRVYWTEAGWSARTSNNWTQPRYWTDNRYNGADQPVVGVSWYEAFAYANWHAEQTGLPVRLPTEAEWEYAARGPNALIYPWGNDFDGTRLNFCDVNCSFEWADRSVDDGFQYTAPVGSFPNGASWVGAFDLSGNVWEWTSSLLDSYPYQAADGREAENSIGVRVLRGGSWSGDQYITRAAVRNWNAPFFRDNDLGFRLVVGVAPI